MVRCKFACISKEVSGSGRADIALAAVYSGSLENEEFWAVTPAGNVIFFAVNEQAAVLFDVGSEYYADFSLAVDVR
jgi:hypothetical protein